MRAFSRNPSSRKYLPLFWGSLLLITVLGVLLLRYFLAPPEPPPPVESAPPLRNVTLYFAAPDGSGLMAETRQLAGCRLEEECLRTMVEALIAGPAGQLAPIFPPQTIVRGAGVVDSELQLDFSRTLIDGHPGGSLGELLTVYGLTDTVAVNFPHLRQLRILVEGNAVETLKGHVDLRQPLLPDFSLIVTPPAALPAGASPGKS